MLDDETILRASQRIRAGCWVAFPTETVYGLGADATNDQAVAALFACKGRPRFNPLIIHFADVNAVKQHVEWNEAAQTLASAFWPGPLTLVLPKKSDSSISLLASAGLDTLAVRVPAHPIARAFIAASGVPLAAPSANKSGRISPTDAAHVRAEFGEDAWVLDGGACTVGLESTVVDVTAAPALLRSGAVTQAMLEKALGAAVLPINSAGAIRSPGQLLKHYAPRARLRLHATTVSADEALLAFGKDALVGAKHTLNLSEQGDMVEAAAHLFRFLRQLDTDDIGTIAVMPIPTMGIGEAINDRLHRGAV